MFSVQDKEACYFGQCKYAMRPFVICPSHRILAFCCAFVLGHRLVNAAVDVASIDRQRVLAAANAALSEKPITITDFHAKLSEGGPNDFYSNGDYWWPNPNTTNGLPYVQRDGQTNPENFVEHRKCVMGLRDAIAALGAAYKITGEDRYVKKATELLRVFFLDPKTRMNPSLKYAQAIPGLSSGRGIGIIDTLHLIEVPLAVKSMGKSPAFPARDMAGLKQWFRDYAEWMTTSKNGKDEANAGNNHAVAFWLQVAAFSQLAEDNEKAAECRRRYKEVFVAKQMAEDGSFPAELRRTKPYGYSIFQLDNMASLCQLLSTGEDDLWKFQLPDGRGIRKAMEFMYSFLADKSNGQKSPMSRPGRAGRRGSRPCSLRGRRWEKRNIFDYGKNFRPIRKIRKCGETLQLHNRCCG
jgi:hypothetical protein